jgi:hypothetical protein
LNIPYRESLPQVIDAVVDILPVALQEHFDPAVGGVSDKARQLIPPSNTIGREAKADALNLSAEKYVFSCICHCFFLMGKYNTNRFFWQLFKNCRFGRGKIVPNNISVIYLKLFKNGYNNTTFNYLNCEVL